MEIPETTREALLRRWPVARLATLGPDRAPQVVPIVFAWNGVELWTPVDGKPKSDGEIGRVRNVRRYPQVSVLLDQYDADWTRLWWLRLDGIAEVVRATGHDTGLRMDAPARALRGKYPQYKTTELFRDPPTALVISVTRTRSWCAGPEALAAVEPDRPHSR
jgi:PPOX class probable F420-dependent enzyme